MSIAGRTLVSGIDKLHRHRMPDLPTSEEEVNCYYRQRDSESVLALIHESFQVLRQLIMVASVDRPTV